MINFFLIIISIKSLFDNCPLLSSYDYAPDSIEKVKPMNQIQKRAKIVKLADKLCFQKGCSSETQFSIRPVRQWVGQKHQDTKFHRFRGLEKSLISQSRIISAPGSFRVFFFLKQYMVQAGEVIPASQKSSRQPFGMHQEFPRYRAIPKRSLKFAGNTRLG